MTRLEGTVTWGANNIFTVRGVDDAVFHHVRIKGKILADESAAYNPLAPGDTVMLQIESDSSVQITERLPRRNAVVRWNPKRRTLQTVAANVDRLYIVTSAAQPRYAAQFIDRVLVMTELESIDAAVVINKSDLTLSPPAAEHVAALQAIGYTVLRTVATGGDRTDVAALDETAGIGTYALFGRSGVGKSSLINALVPGSSLTVGGVSHRYDRGRHTTTLARQVLQHNDDGIRIFIDTPGIRDYPLIQYEVTEIAAGFREFRSYITSCRMPSCTHLHEPECAVRSAVADGAISEVRYRSYRRIVAEEQR